MQMQISQTQSLYHASKSFQDGKADDMFIHILRCVTAPSFCTNHIKFCQVQSKRRYHNYTKGEATTPCPNVKKYVQDPFFIWQVLFVIHTTTMPHVSATTIEQCEFDTQANRKWQSIIVR